MFERLLAYEYYLASTQLALAMIGMGATLRPRDFVAVVRAPKAFILGYLCVLVGSPFVALAVTQIFTLERGIATGLFLIAAVPGGTMSNLFAYFARANVPLSIALTATATLTCLVSTPIVLNFFAADLLPGAVAMPVEAIASDIFLVLLIPLAAGMALGARFENYREPISKYCIRASIAAIFALIVISSGSGRVEAGEYGLVTLAAMGTLGLLLLAMPALLARALRMPRADIVTVSIETCFRNGNLAVLIKATVFPVVVGVPDPFADQVLFVALLYGLIGLLIAMPVAARNRRHVLRATPSINRKGNDSVF